VIDNGENKLEVERFWSKVKKTKNCWVWTDSIAARGYGRLIFDNKPFPAHRLSWELHYGKIPGRLCVLHKCDNRRCVRPDHLFLGTRADNVYDMVKKGRGKPCRGETNGRSKLTDNQIREIRSSVLSDYELSISNKISKCEINKIRNKQAWVHI
jgi:hypothetical protein